MKFDEIDVIKKVDWTAKNVLDMSDGCQSGLSSQLCKCGINPVEEPHSCPYQSDVNDNDDEEYCTCCEDCYNECIMEI